MFLRHDFILMSPTNWNMGMTLISVSASTAFLGSGYDFSKPSFESSGARTAGQSLSYYYLPLCLAWQGRVWAAYVWDENSWCIWVGKERDRQPNVAGTGSKAVCRGLKHKLEPFYMQLQERNGESVLPGMACGRQGSHSSGVCCWDRASLRARDVEELFTKGSPMHLFL